MQRARAVRIHTAPVRRGTAGEFGQTLGRELRALALNHTAPVRRGTAGELGHKVACRLRPHSASGRLYRGHRLLSEDCVGRAVPGLPHRVSPEWGQPHSSSALDGAAAVKTVARTRGVAVLLSWSWSY